MEARRNVSLSKKKSVGRFWYSADAINLFRPDKPTSTDVLDEVNMCIILFEKALETAYGCLVVADTAMMEAETSANKVRWFGAKIRCVKKALEAVVETMGKGNVGETWTSCCDKACALRHSRINCMKK